MVTLSPRRTSEGETTVVEVTTLPAAAWEGDSGSLGVNEPESEQDANTTRAAARATFQRREIGVMAVSSAARLAWRSRRTAVAS